MFVYSSFDLFSSHFQRYHLAECRVVTKISSCQVLVVSSWGGPPPPQEDFEVQLLPFSKRHYRPKKAIFIKSTAILAVL